MLPGVAAIGGAIKPAPFAPAREKPRLPPHLPERGEQSVRIVRVENDIDRAGVLVFAQDFRPGLAAIGRAKNSALVVRPIGMPEGRDKNDVRIFRMDDDRADVAAVFQADIPPIAAAIDGLINAVAIGDIAAQRRLTGAGVDRVVIARRYRQGTDRGSGMLLVEHRLPVGAAVGGFPHTTSDCAEIISVRLTRDAFDRDPAAAPEGSDLAPLHAAPELFVELSLVLRLGCGGHRAGRGRLSHSWRRARGG